MIEFWTSQAERMCVANRHSFGDKIENLARIYPMKRSGLAAYFLSEPWYGVEPTIELTVRTAKARIIELDTFLRTGAPTKHLNWQWAKGERRRRR